MEDDDPLAPTQLPGTQIGHGATVSSMTSAGVAVRTEPTETLDDYRELVTIEQHYALGSELARGGMGKIQVARDRRLARRVAIKTLLATSDELRSRFEREARVTARLQHPSIVPIYEAGRMPSGAPFYAMKLVSGRPLDEVIAKATTTAARLALLPNALAVVEALAYAHEERVAHRDLKPQNVLVGKFGETIVIDWGLAKDLASDEVDEVPATPYRASGDGVVTELGEVMGTPSYMPIEQALGEAVDARADVYSLGALLYHVLSGRPPYLGRTSHEILEKVLAGPPEPLSQITTGLPRDLVTLVDAAMARDREARPTSAQLAEELRRFQTGQLVASHSYSFGELARRWVRKHRVPLSVAAIGVVVLAIVSILGVRQIVAERNVAEVQRTAAQQTAEALLVEEGRRELVAGEAGRALPWLTSAYRQAAAPTPELRLLLAEALAPLEVPRIELGKTKYAHILSDPTRGGVGELVVLVGDDDVTRTVDHKGHELAKLGKVTPLAVPTRIEDRAVVLGSASGAIAVYDAKTGQAGPVLATGDAAWSTLAGNPLLALIALRGATSIGVFDATTGARVATIEGAATGFELSADGRRLAAIDPAGAIGVWEIETGKRLLTRVEAEPFAHLSLDYRGASLAFAKDKTVTVVDLETTKARDWRGRAESLRWVMGSYLFMTERDGEVSSPLTGTILHPGAGSVLASSAYTVIATDTADETAIWEHGQRVATLRQGEHVTAAAFISGGVATVGTNYVRLWTVTGRLVGSLEIETSDGKPAEVSRVGSVLVRTATRTTLWQPGDPRTVLSGALSIADNPEPTTIVVPAVDRVFAQRGTSAAMRQVGVSKWLDWHDAIAVSPDGAHLVVRGEPWKIVSTATEGDPGFSLSSDAHFGTWSPSSKRVAIASYDHVDVFDVTAHQLLFTIKCRATAVTFASDDRHLTVVDGDGIVYSYLEARELAHAQLLAYDDAPPIFSQSGKQLLVSEHGVVTVRDVDTLAVVKRIGRGRKPVYDASGTHILALDADGAIIYDTSGTIVAALADTGAMTAIFVGDRVATGGQDNNVKLWDLTGHELGVYAGFDHPVVAIASRDDFLAALDSQGEFIAWKLSEEQRSPADLVRLAERLTRWRLHGDHLVRE